LKKNLGKEVWMGVQYLNKEGEGVTGQVYGRTNA